MSDDWQPWYPPAPAVPVELVGGPLDGRHEMVPAARLGQPLVYPARADGEQQRDAVLLPATAEGTPPTTTIVYRARPADLAHGRTGRNLGGPVRFDHEKPEVAAA